VRLVVIDPRLLRSPDVLVLLLVLRFVWLLAPGNWVVASWPSRATAHDATDPEPTAAQGAV
jgi:hypothetical protein